MRLAARGWHTAGLNACVLCSFSLPMSCCYVSYLCLLLDFASNYFTVALFHCKSCAFIRSKPRYCQTQWSHRFFVGWIIMLGRGGSLSLPRVVLSVRRSRTIAKHTGFRCFLWVGSSCWEEVTLFHCKNYAFIRSKPHYCQTHCFQRFFVGWLIMLGRGDSLSLQELCFH